MNKVSFIGLGKLGLPLATCLAKNNINVIGIDINEKVVNSLNSGKAPFYEANLQKNIDLAKQNIEYTTDYKDVINTDTTIILVNTPSNKKDGSFSNLYIEQSLSEACKHLKQAKKDYHLFIISSTVMPNSINDSFIPLIESLTGWQLNKEFGVCYIPDFVALGTTIKDFENPEFVVLGQSSEKAGDMALSLYSKIFLNCPEIKKMSLLEGEISKISLNAYICSKISFSNYLAKVCEKFDDVNVDNITNAIGIDKRISTHYFKGGLSFGGTCFPRDTWAFMKMSDRLGMKAHHIEAAEKINQEQDAHLLNKVLKTAHDNKLKKEVSILGLGFKKDTPVVTESSAIKLIESLKEMNYTIHVYDPVEEALDNTKNIFQDSINYHKNFQNCFMSTKFSIIINPYKEFEKIDDIGNDSNVVLDCWRSYNFKKVKTVFVGKKGN
jgi:UDPglucose 6-dehydrogenase